MEVEIRDFGTHENIKYDEIVISNGAKFMISFSNLGARINSWKVPFDNGELKNIILGYESATHVFEPKNLFLGATIGRVAGRIKGGAFILDEKEYQLPVNDGNNHLHGGFNSLDLRKWDYEIISDKNAVDVIFHYEDKTGSNGYPGNMKIEVTHTITSDNIWTVKYRAVTDEPTLFNPTNHVYFNLNGDNSRDIKNHNIQLTSDYYLPLDDENLPTGEVRAVDGTSFDLRDDKEFGELHKAGDEQFNIHKGFDHPFLLNKERNYQAKVTIPEKNIQLLMKTQEPAVIIHTMNDVSFATKIWDNEMKKYAGIALETQKEPDAINHEKFRSIVLKPNVEFKSETSYWIV